VKAASRSPRTKSSGKCDGMPPRAAVATGCVDFVLPPEGIARENWPGSPRTLTFRTGEDTAEPEIPATREEKRGPSR